MAAKKSFIPNRTFQAVDRRSKFRFEKGKTYTIGDKVKTNTGEEITIGIDHFERIFSSWGKFSEEAVEALTKKTAK